MAIHEKHLVNIITIGDSHSTATFKGIGTIGTFEKIGTHKNTYIQIINKHMGPITMNRVQRDSLDFRPIVSEHLIANIKNIVIYCFGEIDIRCQIHKQIEEKQRTLHEVIDTLCKGYCQTLAANKNNEMFTSWLLIPVPPVPKTSCWENPEYPFLGSDTERVMYHRKVKEYLFKWAAHFDIICFDISPFYTNKDGYLLKELSDGNVHIGDSRFVKEELIRIL